MKRTGNRKILGITVVEILIVLAVLAVFLSFATPSLGKASAEAEFTTAVENLEFSVNAARNLARRLDTPVIVHFSSNGQRDGQALTFTILGKGGARQFADLLQPCEIPDSISLNTSHGEIRFDQRGIAGQAAEVTLASRDHDELHHSLQIR